MPPPAGSCRSLPIGLPLCGDETDARRPSGRASRDDGTIEAEACRARGGTADPAARGAPRPARGDARRGGGGGEALQRGDPGAPRRSRGAAGARLERLADAVSERVTRARDALGTSLDRLSDALATSRERVEREVGLLTRGLRAGMRAGRAAYRGGKARS